MLQRGRKSVTSVASNPQVPGNRPAPPDDLTPIQAQLWSDVVNTKPADWFGPDSFPILRQYCCHCESAMRLNAMVNEALNGPIGELQRLLTLRDHESKTLDKLATSMRLTQQSRYNPAAANTAAKKAGSAEKPWESPA